MGLGILMDGEVMAERERSTRTAGGMGWERRGTHGFFYYRVSRDAQGRVVKEYVGRGARADAAAEAVAVREAERVADRRSVAGEVADLAALDRHTE